MVEHPKEVREDDKFGFNPYIHSCTVKQFETHYADQIAITPRVAEILRTIEQEVLLGFSDGLLEFSAFSYLYMLLDFEENMKLL